MNQPKLPAPDDSFVSAPVVIDSNSSISVPPSLPISKSTILPTVDEAMYNNSQAQKQPVIDLTAENDPLSDAMSTHSTEAHTSNEFFSHNEHPTDTEPSINRGDIVEQPSLSQAQELIVDDDGHHYAVSPSGDMSLLDNNDANLFADDAPMEDDEFVDALPPPASPVLMEQLSSEHEAHDFDATTNNPQIKELSEPDIIDQLFEETNSDSAAPAVDASNTRHIPVEPAPPSSLPLKPFEFQYSTPTAVPTSTSTIADDSVRTKFWCSRRNTFLGWG
ncbi:hypothetical protein BD560DRAFT_424171 [Blakeslea trispora]|nr:hypothetical protein BD560DRAFT_424171 [Blakeslea trispora]